jgi:predicted adenine nucleotide alpha hydrolase (AANH) superfamily ATPase
VEKAIRHDQAMLRAMADLPPGTPLLLHACCGPCLSTALERLGEQFALTVYYANPNTAPQMEWERRLEGVRHVLEAMPQAWPTRLLVGAYDADAFERVAVGLHQAPEGGMRCAACFTLRLGETARMARELGLGWFATTLTVGPRKSAAMVNHAGEAAAEAHGVRFLPGDFKKQDGYQRSIALSRQYGLYRQGYCGCRYSMREGG